ncbi:MAG TPA: HlyD family efflux transporter periplasmic adaptor subunit [Gemmatimonadales bacterium]|nr:HlyD family efflux transporter periplasmic adaptor subunit [Gemmatimonadales bacterium]
MTMTRTVALLSLLALPACGSERDDRIVARGTIEVRETDVAPVTSARVLRVAVDEGQPVRAGDTLAVLTRAALPANREQQRARARAAEAALRDLEQGARAPELEEAEAQLRGAEAEAERTALEVARMRSLAAGNAVSRQSLDNAEAAARSATSARDAARERLALLRAGSRPDRIREARADVASAYAAAAAIEADLGDLVLLAPVDGVVIARLAEPGEALAAGTPVLTVGETRRPWVRAYLRAADAGRIAVGHEAEVTLDGVPGRSWRGVVTVVSPRAEFTPRAALSEDEREDLMFGVRVEVTDTTGAVKPGLPATVRLAPLPAS